MVTLMKSRLFLLSSLLLLAAKPLPQGQDVFNEGLRCLKEERLVESLDRFTELVYAYPRSALSPKAREYIWTLTKEIEEKKARWSLTPEERAGAVRKALQVEAEKSRKQDQLIAELERIDRTTRENPQNLVSVLRGSRLLNQTLETRNSGELDALKIQQSMEDIRASLKKGIGQSDPKNVKNLREAKGFLSFYEGDLDGATREWEAALRLDPGDQTLKDILDKVRGKREEEKRQEEIADLLSQGKTNFDLGDPASAESRFKDLIRLDPGNLEARSFLEKIAERRDARKRQDAIAKKLTEAREDINQDKLLEALPLLVEILEMDPSQERARYYLGNIKKTLSLKMSLAPAAAAGAPESPASRPKGDREKAIEAYTVGMAHYVDEDLDKAIECFKKAVDLDPSFEEAVQAYKTAKKERSFR